ncbi:efflux RND transporter periplasmic adaptor subunit [Maribacter sp. MAR_2009_72]|uniref:efflux RND transporter periplasmic adaptor subunit n=1 Tax=Maribacter sp. MAR_2009_72 TaxID=1250050 RepID=UPI00119AA70C|nr:efflux RND transporter periplasmic adaptor subunit [Maribacter sp. MAR_2009_72]TVZ15381.1 Cu(I)/Ag(I) efflux system membrane fusion protein [Maribacter sp. MAR_2009_72]
MENFNTYKKYVVYLMVLLGGLLLGYLFFGQTKPAANDHVQHNEQNNYTCSMHPSVVNEGKGICPICGMELVPMGNMDQITNEYRFTMSERAISLANVQTHKIISNSMGGEVVLAGEIALNENTNATQTTLFDGRIDKLHIKYVGEYVKKGQEIGTIYSPELYLAQDKLLTSSSYKDTHEKLYAAARNTLGLWKLTDKQIDDLLKSGKPIVNFPLVADVSGTVVEILGSEGSYYKQGDPLFKVSNLYSVWAVFQAYEDQLPLLKMGQEILISSEAFPSEPVVAKISFIEPVLDKGKRIVAVRANVANGKGQWKPGMFIKGKVKIEHTDKQMVMVPKSAVLWAGEHSVVYTKPKSSKPIFEMREVKLGEAIGDSYVVFKGLEIGEEVVTNGAFTIDAAAQLQGKKSMLYAKETSMEQIPVTSDKGAIFPNEVNDQIKIALGTYFELKNNLVSSKSLDVHNSAKKLDEQLLQIEVSEGNAKFQSTMKSAKKMVKEILSEESLDQKRISFKKLSSAFTYLADHVQGFGEPIYVQHCPMADNNTGADWLSLEKAIRNPYFGDKMLTCGSVTKVLD